MLRGLEIKLSHSSYFAFIICLLVVMINTPAVLKDDGQSNAFALLAESFLDGQTTLPDISGFQYMDMISYEGNHYLPYPPMPAALLVPFVGIFGNSYIPSSLIALILTCINVFLISKIIDNLKIEPIRKLWLSLAFFLGSPYWFVLTTSNYHYGFAQICATTFALLFITEFLTSKRVILMAIYIGASFLCRQSMIFYALLFLVNEILQLNKGSKPSFKNVASFCLFLSPFILIYLSYNYFRFGNPLDTGYRHVQFIGILAERVSKYGVFDISYIPYNFYHTYIKGHNLIFDGLGEINLKGIDIFGTSLSVASPFVFVAFFTRLNKSLIVSSLCAIIPIMIIHLLYHNNGFHQVNTSRFTLDFFPVLFLLIASGSSLISARVLKTLVIYAIGLNVFSFVIYQFFQSN